LKNPILWMLQWQQPLHHWLWMLQWPIFKQSSRLSQILMNHKLHFGLQLVLKTGAILGGWIGYLGARVDRTRSYSPKSN
jgi:hypothetical protein